MSTFFDFKKIMSIRFSFLVFSIILFIDIYCLLFIEEYTSFLDIKIEVIKQYIDGKLILGVALFIFYMSTLTKFITTFILLPFELGFIKIKKKHKFKINKNVILRKALVEKDTVLFELYKKHQKYIEDLFDSCAFCVGVVILILWDFNFNNSISHQLIEYLFNQVIGLY